MSEITEGLRIKGQVIIEEINPATKEVVSKEIGENIICVSGANSLAASLTTGTMDLYNYMVLSENTAAVDRANVTLPGSSKIKSTGITPTVLNSITTWVHTFAAGGSPVVWKFGMSKTDDVDGHIWNEYKFGAVKDNNTNDLKITYNASFAP
jgi:hypothetical protein